MTKVRVRFAPSPTGSPHIGNIRTALWDWLFARHTGGTFILRIEDTDQKREISGAVEEIKEGLRWYGLDYDEGPDIGGPYGPYIQSQRLAIYREHVDRLIADGKAYYAYDTPEELNAFREQQQQRGLPTGYSRRHRHLTDEDRERYERERSQYRVVRLAVPLEGRTIFTDAVYGEISYENRVLDDIILLKSDGYPTYHLAAQVDDHLMEITHVLRGEDWIPSAPLHILLYQAFGWEPPVFVHLPNMLGPDKKKFGKRNGALPALEYPKAGYLQEAMFNFTALQGWSPKEERDLYTREELIEKFDISGILNHSPISDPEKLNWYNGQYIRQLAPLDLAARTLPFLQESGLVGPDPDASTLSYIGQVLQLEQERMRTLREAAFPTEDGKPALADFFLLDDDQYAFDEKAVQKRLLRPGVDEVLRGVRDGFAALDVFDVTTTEGVVRAIAEGKDVKAADVIHPVRVAVSGRTTGPGLFEILAVLGRERCLRRLDRALGLIDEREAVH